MFPAVVFFWLPAVATCLIGLGSNLNDRAKCIQRALELLDEHAAIDVVSASECCSTAAAGSESSGEFLNAAATLTTELDPVSLLRELLNVEDQLGRQREQRWGARTVDLDLLLYDQVRVDTEELTLPHPRMSFRRFVLEPAAQIAPEWVLPMIGMSVADLLEHINTADNYVAMTGPRVGFEARLAEHVGCAEFAGAVIDPVSAEHWHRDQASQDLETWIEFLGRRATVLRRRADSRERWLVSDFWLDELLVGARNTLQPREVALFEQRFREANRDVPRPKLLVVVDGGPMGFDCTTHQGPTLHLNGVDADWAVQELLAAIQSMM